MSGISFASASRALIFAVAVLLPVVGSAQNERAQAEMRAALDAANKAKVAGPADVKVADQAVMKLPKGFLYVPTAESKQLLMAMGNRPGPDLVGTVFPEGDAPWFVVLQFVKSGFVKDDDAKEWKADEMLSSLKQGTEEANAERRSRGIPEVEVVGWVQPPTYDATSHRLVWSLSSKSKNEPAGTPRGVNYNTYALGRQGYITMNLVTGMDTIEADKPVAHQLLAALQYDEGKRYTDFNSATDHVAEFGLAALVGGIAAKKLGFFALIAAFLVKFWKLAAIALFALIGIGSKLLGRKKAAGEAAPPQA